MNAATETSMVKVPQQFREFLRALRKGKWSFAEITGDMQQPIELIDFLTAVGLEKAEDWIIRGMDQGYITEKGVRDRLAEKIQSTTLTESSSKPERFATEAQDAEAMAELVAKENEDLQVPVVNEASPLDIPAETSFQEEPATDDLMVDASEEAEDVEEVLSGERNGKHVNKELLGGNTNRVVGPDTGRPSAPQLKRETIQKRINELVLHHGSNLHRRADVMTLLDGSGVEFTDLTPDAMDIAQEYARGVVQNKAKGLAKKKTSPLYSLPAGSRFKTLPGGNYGNLVGTLLEVNESDAKVRIKEGAKSTDVRWSSGTEVIYLGKGDESEIAQEERSMKVTEAAAREMLTEMGLSKAVDCSVENLHKTLRRIDKMMEGLEQPKSKEGKRLLKDVLNALQEGITFTVDSGDGADEETEVKEKNVKAKTKPSTNGQAKRGPKGEKDKFGNRLGSQAATINAAMSKKSKNTDTLVEETSLPKARVLGHMKWLMEQGYAHKTDKGYALK